MIEPVLRFHFSESWVSKKIGSLGDFKGGGTPSTESKEFWDGDIPWISSSDINEGQIHNLNISRYITDEAISKSATKLIPANSLLFVSRVGVGKFAINNSPVCTSQDFVNLYNVKENTVFLAYYFIANKTILLRYAQGTSIKGFTSSDLKAIKLFIPSLPEQQKITSFLTSVDKRISQLKRKKQLLEQYKKGIMQQIFSQELRFKRDDGSNYPDWEQKKLGEVATITTGSSNRQDSTLDGEYTFFDRSEDIRTSSQFLFDKEALIIAGEGSTFNPKYFKGKFDLHQRTYAIFDFERAVAHYLLYFISANPKHLLSHAVGSTVKSLRLPMFKGMPINLPCQEEQTKIANFLSAIDTKISQTQQQIALTQQFKKGLLQQMFV